jgi:hypothetical protein
VAALDTVLELLTKHILAKLEMVAEGTTQDLERPNLHRVHPGSTPPPGAYPGRSKTGPPDPCVSLRAYNEWLLARAQTVPERLKALAEAMRDYETAQHPPRTYMSADSAQNKKERDEAILSWEGYRPEWVAVYEHCSESNVRKVRKANQRDQKLGHREPTA